MDIAQPAFLLSVDSTSELTLHQTPNRLPAASGNLDTQSFLLEFRTITAAIRTNAAKVITARGYVENV